MTKKTKREPVVPREVLRAFIKDYNLQTAEDVQNALKNIFADMPTHCTKFDSEGVVDCQGCL